MSQISIKELLNSDVSAIKNALGVSDYTWGEHTAMLASALSAGGGDDSTDALSILKSINDVTMIDESDLYSDESYSWIYNYDIIVDSSSELVYKTYIFNLKKKCQIITTKNENIYFYGSKGTDYPFILKDSNQYYPLVKMYFISDIENNACYGYFIGCKYDYEYFSKDTFDKDSVSYPTVTNEIYSQCYVAFKKTNGASLVKNDIIIKLSGQPE